MWSPRAGGRFQLTVCVDDLDVVVVRLAADEVRFTGPRVQPWGKKTVTQTVH